MKIYLLLLLSAVTLSAQNHPDVLIGLNSLPYNHPQSAISNNPSLFTDYRNLIRSNYSTAYAIPNWQAQALQFSLCRNTKNYGIGFFKSGLPNFQTFGLQLAIGMKLHSHWSLGLRSIGQRHEIVEQAARHQFSHSVFLGYKGKNKFVWTQALHWQKSSNEIPLTWDSEFCFRGKRHWDAYLNLCLGADGRSSLGLSTEYAFVPQCLLRQKIAYQNTWEFGAALEFRWRQWALISNYSWQKYVGPQLGFGLSYLGK